MPELGRSVRMRPGRPAMCFVSMGLPTAGKAGVDRGRGHRRGAGTDLTVLGALMGGVDSSRRRTSGVELVHRVGFGAATRSSRGAQERAGAWDRGTRFGSCARGVALPGGLMGPTWPTGSWGVRRGRPRPGWRPRGCREAGGGSTRACPAAGEPRDPMAGTEGCA